MSNEIVTGYKATDKNMQCRGYQFELGKWHKHEGEIELCKSGFHFCPHPSGVWAYYYKDGTRVFRCEARIVIRCNEPGADVKYVASEIRLIEEIVVTGDRNTGDRNTGYGNTGDRNTGYWNTGNRNTGDRNTGHGNTGDRNTGYWNTGYGNTGHGNTGDRNTGYWNTGNRNTGDRNTGHGNTGHGNACDFSSGFFCAKDPLVVCFDKQTKLTRSEFVSKYPEYEDLCSLIHSAIPFDYERFSALPGWTLKKCKDLHKKHTERIKSK